jgi:hypothetical protein
MLICGMSSAVGPQRLLQRALDRASFRKMLRPDLASFRSFRAISRAVLSVALVTVTAFGSGAKDHSEINAGLSVEVPEPEADVLRAVQGVSLDQIIHGTYVYEKDKTLSGAHEARESSAFHDGNAGGGTVFYKVADNVVAPRNFKGSNDVGTITVRYIVQSVGPTSTALRIDAVFIESSGHGVHRSEGTVELAEYDAIKSHIRAMQATRKREQDEIRKLQQEDLDRRALADRRKQEAQDANAKTESSVKDLQQNVDDLKRQVEARVKTSGVPLKSAPFRSAATLQSLPAKSDVLIMIVTQYWYGVETEDGHHGWIRRSELEALP